MQLTDRPAADFEFLPDFSHLLNKSTALREAFFDQGVLLFRRYLYAEEVLDLRECYFSRCDPSLFQPGTARRSGIYSGQPNSLTRHGIVGHPAWAFARSYEYSKFVDQTRLKNLAELLLNVQARRVRRSPVRHFYPSSGVPTPAHRDREYLDSTRDQVITIWIPIGDCTPDMGGIAYLQGSHMMNYERLRESLTPVDGKPKALTRDLNTLAQIVERQWLYANCMAGDVVVHCADILHAALPCTSSVMRLSTDIRFTTIAHPGDARWNDHWSADDGY